MMTIQECKVLDFINSLQKLKTIDAKVNYAFANYDLDLEMEHVYEYFKNNRSL